MNETKLSKKEKLKKALIIITVIWLSKIAICVAIREYKNSKFLWMYENSENSRYYDLHIDRKLHFFSLKYGVLGVSYHYTVDDYDAFDPSRLLGTNDEGIFRVSLLHYGYIQDYWPISLRTDYDIIVNVQDMVREQ